MTLYSKHHAKIISKKFLTEDLFILFHVLWEIINPLANGILGEI